MLKVLLIWLLALTGTPDHFSPRSYYCREYNLVVTQGLHQVSDKVCYTSTLTKEKKKHVLTIKTDSLTLHFGVLRTFPLATSRNGVNKGSYTGSQTFAIILGEPDQLYVIREETRVEENQEQSIRYYVFSVLPINPRGRLKPIEGHVLEVSNREICYK